MFSGKTKNTNPHNAELINTYYCGTMPPSEAKNISLSFPKKNRALNYVEAAIIPVVILVSALAGYKLPLKHNSALSHKADEVITLTPVNQSKSLLYYPYAQIKNSDSPILLNTKNKSVAITFQKAADLEKSLLYFTAKGYEGTEKLAIIFKDKFNLSNANREDIILTTALPSDRWQRFQINLKNTNLSLDKTQITQIRFESSPHLTGNTEGSLIYVKDIAVDFAN